MVYLCTPENGSGPSTNMALILTVIASPPKPLEECCQNLVYEFLSTCSMSRCVHLKMNVVGEQSWPNGGHLSNCELPFT